jgi:hypothetical protein
MSDLPDARGEQPLGYVQDKTPSLTPFDAPKKNWQTKKFWHIMAGMGHLAAIPAILIRHNQMVPYVPEKFYFAGVQPKEAEKLREGPDSHPDPLFFRKHRRNKLKREPGPWFSGKIVRHMGDAIIRRLS